MSRTTASDPVPVDTSNVEQLRAWDGDEGAYWAAHAEQFDRSAAPYHRHLLELAAIGPHDRVLDIGCGTGQTTRDAARAATQGSALGVDLSSPMLAYAQRRATEEGVTNVTFEQADAQVYPFEPAGYDVAISRMAAMFFGDHVTAFRNIGRALTSGGRLVLVTWQPLTRNPWLLEIFKALDAGRDRPMPPANAGPFALSEPKRVRAVLTEANYDEVVIEGREARIWLGEDVDDACRFVLGLMGWLLEELDEARRAGALEALHDTMAAHETRVGVHLDSAAWFIRAVRP